MRVLVTGGAGFLGSHLCDYELDKGHDVVCLDNLYTGSMTNIAHLASNPHFMFVKHDVVDVFPDSSIGDVQQIFHLACPASPVHYQSDPVKTMMTCVLGSLHALEYAKKCNARVLISSTSEVYGDPTEHPQTEEYRGNVSCTGPRACYDEGKRAAETLFFDFYRKYGVQIRVARIFNTYGPRMNEMDGRIISNFVTQALRGKPLTIFGTGKQTRSFCFFADQIRGLHALINGPHTGPINIGNPEEYTVLEVAERILGIIRKSDPSCASRIVFEEEAKDDPKQRRPDIRKAEAILGWKPTIPLAEGLAPTIEYFRQVVGGKIIQSMIGGPGK